MCVQSDGWGWVYVRERGGWREGGRRLGGIFYTLCISIIEGILVALSRKMYK